MAEASVVLDGHRRTHAHELDNLPFGMATAVQAGIPRERFLNYRTADEVIAWASALRAGEAA